MTTLELEPANAGGTPDLIRGLVVVEATPKRPKRSRKVEPEEPDLIAAK